MIEVALFSLGPRRRHRTMCAGLVAAILLAGCATTPASKTSAVGDAATQPLRDIGVVQIQPPAELESAGKEPYRMADGADCGALRSEIATLDGLLGPDIDTGAKDSAFDPEELAAQALGGVVDIPFRGVVRRVTGAETRDRAMRRARLGGQMRRAFLKGVVTGLKCPDAG